MDILKKMFQQKEGEHNKDSGEPLAKDEFRKPQWFEEAETDDELFDDDRKFAFQIFTNPMELQKHFERQMQQILEAVNEMEGGENKGVLEKNLKEDYMKPGFESEILKEFEKQKGHYFDTDLDGEIYPDQLHSLIQRFANGEGEVVKHLQDPEVRGNILPRNDQKSRRNNHNKPKLSDEEIILGKIHGTLDETNQEQLKRAPPFEGIPRIRPDIMTPMTPMMPRGSFGGGGGGAFEGTYQGPKMFSQSVMTKTIRKPDGTYETTKIAQDSQGNKTTTVTRTVNGKTETTTTYDGAGGTINKSESELQQAAPNKIPDESKVYSDRNVFVSKEGYALPRNLW